MLSVGPVAAAAGPSGSATAENVVAGLTFGSQAPKIGVDRATSIWGSSPSAEAHMDFLTAGTTTLGGGSRMASTQSESGSDVLGTGSKTIDGLASATVTSATVEALIEAARAHSAAVVTMADLSLLDGLVTAATAQTATESTVGTTVAEVSRTLTLGDVRVLSIRKLLELLGVEPTSLTCSGLEAAGAELGVDTADACVSYANGETALDAAQAALDALGITLAADLGIAESTIAGLTVITQPLLDLAATYGVDLGGILGTLLGGAGRNALISEIEARLSAVDAGSSRAAAGTCAEVEGAVADVVGAVPALGATLTPLRIAVIDACAILQSLLDDVLDVSLLGLTAMTVGLNATAEPDAPNAEGTGTIGAVTIGNRAVTVAGITSLGGALQAAIATAQAEAADALTALGLGSFPEPTIEILGVDTSAGRDQAKTWFASVTVTGLHVSIPPVPISLPSGASLAGVLGAPAPSVTAPAGSRHTAAAPVATTPNIVLDVAVFTGDARYNAAGPVNPIPNPGPGAGTGGRPLASTGAGGLQWLAAGLVAMVAGATMHAAQRFR